MHYRSTRGETRGIAFKDAVMMGLAADGGLLLPETIPAFSAEELAQLVDMPYADLAYAVMSRFATDIPASDLKDLIDRSYATFDHPEVTPVVHHDGVHVLELFHGPTLAFKDVALQFLGNLFEYLLKQSGRRMNILGATSGDTGSAAIYGVRGKDNINIFILHPHKRVSPIQELQMTTVTDANVYNLAIRGTFDDGQRIVKEIFGDAAFKSEHSLGAVNSINWARILAQIVYYFYAWARVRKPGREKVAFAVPTGNFGDIFAGYMAKRMGLPVDRLILATNENNILSRFVEEGVYASSDVHETWSPSMDIQVASNFERYLFYLCGEDCDRVVQAMAEFRRSGRLSFTGAERETIRSDFRSRAVSNSETLEQITQFYRQADYILDPHTAVGVKAGRDLAAPEMPLVCLSTAHPAKFGDAVQKAIGIDPPRPASLEGIEEQEQRMEVIEADTETIKAYLASKAI
ncbi:MAG: threonine synthase [Desulfuromonadales bacterium]|nr:threonine synthase [Desulfuromonadales bacterium]